MKGSTLQLYANYGFQGMTFPDPIANNLQGTYGNMTDPNYLYYSDAEIANQAQSWLANKRVGDQPWCLTVGFQNPHDQEFFPSGTEYQNFTDQFANPTVNPSGYVQNEAWQSAATVNPTTPVPNALMNPPSYGYPSIPPNWQSGSVLQSTKPLGQIFNKTFCEAEWGGVNGTSSVTTFTISPYPSPSTPYAGYTPPTKLGIGYAPYAYWQKALNLYTYLQTVVDAKIGQVLDAMRPEVAKNTIVVFTSDHGDYVGAHGLVAGKTISMYDEALRVPLIIYDPTGKFTGDIDNVRTQLTSSVDVMPMLVGLGNGGQTSWMQGDYQTMYGGRYNMFPILKSSSVAGLDYALFATDEVIDDKFDFATAPDQDRQRTPVHIVGVITAQYKLGVYSKWPAGSVEASPVGREYEYYDYSSDPERLEINNTYSSSLTAEAIKDNLLSNLVPNILKKPLPDTYRLAQEKAKAGMIAFNLLETKTLAGFG